MFHAKAPARQDEINAELVAISIRLLELKTVCDRIEQTNREIKKMLHESGHQRDRYADLSPFRINESGTYSSSE
jgi:transposase-like protein